MRNQPTRMRRWARLAGLAALPVLAAVSLSEVAGWPWLRAPTAMLLSKVLDREIRIDKPFRLHLLASPTLHVGRFSIAGPEWRDSRQILRIDGLSVGAAWSELLDSPASIDSLTIDAGELQAIRLRDGRSTWTFGGEEERSGKGSGAATLPRIRKIDVGSFEVHVDDALEQLQLVIKARTASADGQPDRLEAKGEGAWRSTAAGFVLALPAWQESVRSRQAKSLAVRATLGNARLKFDGDIGEPAAFDHLSGSVELEGSSLADLAFIPGLTLPATPPFELKGRVERHGTKTAVQIYGARIGGSALNARLQYDTAPATARLTGEIYSDKLALSDLSPGIGVGASGNERGARSRDEKGKADNARRLFSSDRFDLPSMRQMDVDIALDLKRLDLGSSALRPIQSLRARLSLEQGSFALADLQASVAGGTIAGRTALDASVEDQRPTWKASLDWKGVDLKDWIRASDDEFFVGGRFSGRTIIESRGRSTAEILGAADGSIRGSVVDGAVSHLLIEAADLDAAQALGVMIKGPEPLALSCAILDVRIVNGKVKPELVLLNTRDSIIFVDGLASLKNETLQLKLVPAPKDWSPLSLSAPVTIGGTFTHPTFGIEAKPIALKVFSAIVLGAINPIAAIIPFMEAPKAKEASGCAPAIDLVRRKGSSLQRAASETLSADRAAVSTDLRESVGSNEGPDKQGTDGAPKRILPPANHPALNRP